MIIRAHARQVQPPGGETDAMTPVGRRTCHRSHYAAIHVSSVPEALRLWLRRVAADSLSAEPSPYQLRWYLYAVQSLSHPRSRRRHTFMTSDIIATLSIDQLHQSDDRPSYDIHIVLFRAAN